MLAGNGAGDAGSPSRRTEDRVPKAVDGQGRASLVSVEGADCRHPADSSRAQPQELPRHLRRPRAHAATPSMKAARRKAHGAAPRRPPHGPPRAVPPRHARPRRRTAAAELPTDERLKPVANEPDPHSPTPSLPIRPLPADRQQPARAASRPTCRASGTTASQPPWDSKYTVQHQHRDELLAGRDRATSRECHEALFDMIDDCVEPGPTTAKAHYGADGWVLHHNTDLWRGTAPINAVEPRHLADRRRVAVHAPVGALPVHAATRTSSRRAPTRS